MWTVGKHCASNMVLSRMVSLKGKGVWKRADWGGGEGDAKSRLQLRACPKTGWGRGDPFTADGAPQAVVKGLQVCLGCQGQMWVGGKTLL